MCVRNINSWIFNKISIEYFRFYIFMARGKLYMIPITLGSAQKEVYQPILVEQTIDRIQYFIVENTRTARQYIRSIFPDKNLNDLTFYQVDKHHNYQYDSEAVFECLESGNDVGFMSEAGCPGIADPGSEVVRACHTQGIQVVPLVGPSSILLVLMASGMNGQHFTFEGYLPFDDKERIARIRQMYASVVSHNHTHIFIEAPYRNDKLLTALVQNMPSSGVRVGMAVDLTTPDEEIIVQDRKGWYSLIQNSKEWSWHKRPAIFIIGR